MDKRKKTVLVVVVAVAVLGGLTVAQSLLSGPREEGVDGTITYVDPETRTATLEFISPRNGKQMEMKGTVPPECEILLNGMPAKMEDIKAGDKAHVTARWDKKTKEAVPLKVTVTRPG
jgi:hypothetical protein